MATKKAAAHQELWHFLADISEECVWHPGKPEAAVDLFAALCYIMHPIYGYGYLSGSIFPLCLEVLDMQDAEIKKLLSDTAISQQLTDTYTRVVSSKIRMAP